MFQLLKESLLIPFLCRPGKCILYFVLCIIGVRKFNDFFSWMEKRHARVDFLKTLYFNVRSLPVRQALRVPLFLYRHVEIASAKGKIVLDTETIHAGMIRWGRFDSYRSQGVTRIQNRGTIVFKGKARIIRGNEICVFEQGTLTLGDDCFLGENTLIYCQSMITAGDSLRLTYHSQIFDTDFHYSMNLADGTVRRKEKPVIIGDYNWFGNRTTIKKGTKTPHHLTVAASYSVLNKDYTSVPEYSILGGIPAKVIASGYSRLWNNEQSRIAELEAWFQQHPTEAFFAYDLSKVDLADLIER